VLSVVLVAQPDGSTTAQIDGVGFPLPPSVAALLGILKADGGEAPDHLVGWKSVPAIQAALKEGTKQKPSEAAVKQLVYRLRDLLELHLQNRFLVQFDRRYGYRFAMRRAAGIKTEGDNL
jgi:hypothetical protein